MTVLTSRLHCKRTARSIKSAARDMAISEVRNFTGGPVRDSHVKLFIAFEPYFLSEILNLGGLGAWGAASNPALPGATAMILTFEGG